MDRHGEPSPRRLRFWSDRRGCHSPLWTCTGGRASSSSSSRYLRAASPRDGEDLRRTTQEDRGDPQRFENCPSCGCYPRPFRSQRARGGSRRRRRAGPRRQWFSRTTRNGGSYLEVDCHREQTHQQQREEGQDRPHSRRRIWLSLEFRRSQFAQFKKECCSDESFTEMPERRSSVHLRDDRIQSSSRFCLPSSPARRTIPARHHSPGLAHFQIQSPALPEPCEVDVASRRDLGCTHPKSPPGSKSACSALDSSRRAGIHRWRKLDSFQCQPPRATAPLPGLCRAPASDTSRNATQRVVRYPLGRGFPRAPKGGRQLRGCQEEVKQFRQGSPKGAGGGPPTKAKAKTSPARQTPERPEGAEFRDLCPNQLDQEVPEVYAKTGAFSSANSNSQSPVIKVPGAEAGTYTGRVVFQQLFRTLMRSRSRLGCFARSFAARRFLQHEEDTTPKDVFPMPLPYPEVFRKEGPCQDRDARKKIVVGIIIGLNYLHLNRPRKVEKIFQRGEKLNQQQWDAVRRIEHLLGAWLTVSPVGPEEMGRTAQKVESLEKDLSSLTRLASALAKPGAGYFPPSQSSFKPGADEHQPSIGRLKMDGFSTFKPVDPSRLSFVGLPKFNPVPYLDPTSQRIFLDPLATRTPVQDASTRPPKLRVHCSRSEKVKLFQLLDASQRLRLHLPEEVTPLFGSGLFSVPKDLTRDRLILDSRGANILESPPERWIRSLGSCESLTKIVLEPHQQLAASANDLRDFYYLFQASESRSRRNVLVGGLDVRELPQLSCLKPEHVEKGYVYGSLSTLAMGDCQAVELAQSCHLGLALQSGVAHTQNLTTFYKPWPRLQTAVGLVIDDFVALSVVEKKKAKEQSDGARLADVMQSRYEEVGLIPNKKKAFRDQLSSSFWGGDLDGEGGLIRGALKRAIPVCGILIKVIQIGAANCELLEVLAGSIISLFLLRRRFLSLLDSLFGAFRGKEPDEVVALNGKTLSDLLLIALLLPVAVTNLRALPPSHFGASDASGWGEAGVAAPIPYAISKELLRHCLRKSVWTKLLSPSGALLRSRGVLAEEEELPDGCEKFEKNPLWELCANCLTFSQVFSKRKSGQRHINVGELRAAIKLEQILGRREPTRRLLLGLDSQVALGCLMKGRSASPALNAVLSQSIPLMIALDLYSEVCYFHTSSNRADQPTRGKEPFPPSVELPAWWKSASEGRFEEFDAWLKECSLDEESVAGLPPFSELCGGVSPPPCILQEGPTSFTSPQPERGLNTEDAELPELAEAERDYRGCSPDCRGRDYRGCETSPR